MAHQSHSIPWNTLSSNFKYMKIPHIDSRFPDVYPLDKPNQAKDFDFFCKALVKQIREFGITERAKYEPAEEYKRRSRTWTISSKEPDPPLVTNSDEIEISSGKRSHVEKASKHDTHMIKRSTIEEPETRKVFSDHFQERFRRPDRSFYPVACYQYIENWTFKPDESDEMSRRLYGVNWIRYQIWCHSGACSDMAQTLMMEAACATQPLSSRQRGRIQREHMETLMLLIHYPSPIAWGWKSINENCCNYASGLDHFARKALEVYICLNLLFTMREAGSDVCTLTGDLERAPSSDFLQFLNRQKLQFSDKRPRYMNTKTWQNLVGSLVRPHSNRPEIPMYEPFLFQKLEGDEIPTEWDLMADVAQLREFLRGVWKVMVIYEVLWTDFGEKVNWEYLAKEALHQLFRRGYRNP